MGLRQPEFVARQATGIDHDSNSIELARTEYSQEEFTWLNLGVEETNREFGSNSFDVVLSWTVLQHLAPPLVERASDAIQDVLSPEGYLIAAEETTEDSADHVWGRSKEEYAELFDNLELVFDEKRHLEPTYGNYSAGGEILVFRKSHT